MLQLMIESEIIFLIEGKKYSENELKKKGMKKYHIEEIRKNDICVYDNKEEAIKINFVGIINFERITLGILPKYEELKSQSSNFKKLKKIIDLLRKYKKNENIKVENATWLTEDPEDSNISNLSLADFFIKDYFKYGLYFRDTKSINLNRGKRILWGRTVSEIDPIFVNKQPIYHDAYNIDHNKDVVNLITKVHKWIINWCFKNFGPIFGYEYHENYEGLELNRSKELILSKLENELQDVFISRKINLLKAMIALLKRIYYSEIAETWFFGVEYFEYVWEKVLSYSLNNEIEKFKKEMSRPLWELENNEPIKEASLRPDIVIKKNHKLYILDAKYYNISYTSNSLNNNPGVSDVTKQFLYEKSLNNVDYEKVNNAFIFPGRISGDELFKYFGKVKMDLFPDSKIKLYYICPYKVYDSYIMGEKFNDNILTQLINKSGSYCESLV